MVQKNCVVKPKVIAIVGPTASGKTAVGVRLAKLLGGEIISADSMQIYRHMDIGTAKVTKEEMQGVVHHLIDIVDPTENYSVAMWVEEARQKILDITSRGKTPIIVGGTGLYVTSLLKGWTFHSVPEDKALREYYHNLYNEKGIEPLKEEIESKDPELAHKLDFNKVKAVIRALEILNSKDSAILDRKESDEEYDYLLIGLSVDREYLYEKINARVDKMMNDGLIDEFKNLVNVHGLTKDCQSAGAIGYRELFPLVEGTETIERTIELLKQHSRNYAKRQLTWMKKMDKIIWLSPHDEEIFIRAKEFVGGQK